MTSVFTMGEWSSSVSGVMPVDSSEEGPEASVTTTPDDSEAALGLYRRWRYWLLVVLLPILAVFGVVGNLLSLSVMQRRRVRGRSASVYMSALAVTDSLVLLLNCPTFWMRTTFGMNLLNMSLDYCRFYRFIFPTCYTYSTWIVVSLSVERFIAVCLPLKARFLCKRSYAVTTVCLLAVTLSAVYVFNVWAWEMDGRGYCIIRPAVVYYRSMIEPWITSVLYSYAPFFILVTCSGAMVVGLWRAHSLRLDMTAAPPPPPPPKEHHPAPNADAARKQQKAGDVDVKITKTVILICFSFLLLTLPVTLFYAILHNSGLFGDPGPQMELAEALVLLFGLTNHAINFWIYLFSSEMFYSELRLMLGCRSTPPNQRPVETVPGPTVSSVSEMTAM